MKHDHGLTARMVLTIIMLAFAYVALIGILFWAGINPYLIFGLGIVMVFFQYFMSDKLVLAATKSKVVTEKDRPKLHSMVDRLSKSAGIPKPKNIAIMDSEAPNAFATGRSPKHATVAVTTGLLNKLNDEELEAVIGHELGHVKNKDVMVMTWASLIIVVAGFLMQMLFWMSLFGGFGGRGRSNGGGGQLMIIMMIVYVSVIAIYFVSQLLVRALSRYRELAADRVGAELTGNPRHLASALRKISSQIAMIPEKDLRQIEHANAFFIIPALQGKTMAAMMSSHPPTDLRIERLMNMDRFMRGQ